MSEHRAPDDHQPDQHDQHDQHAGPSVPAAMPQLDLRHRDGPRVLKDVVVSTSALQGGVHTRTCPQCGLNPTTTMARRTWQYVPPWVYVGLVLNVLILAMLYYAARVVVKGAVSLCDDCAAADRRGRTIQSMSVIGLVAFPVLLGVGLGAIVGAEAGIFGAAAGVVSGIAGMIAAHRMTRFDVIRCTMVDKKKGTLTLKASDTFGQVLAAEAPRALG